MMPLPPRARAAARLGAVVRKLSVGVLVASLSLVATLGLLEAFLRAIDYPPASFSPWVRAVDTAYAYAARLSTRMRRDPEYDIRFETNALGLRDDEIVATGGRYRILLLGDSFTSGYGVERGALFADLLERELDVDVVNAGVGGYEIVHQIYYYAGRGAALEPDLVVYALYLGNDICRNHEWLETPEGLRSRDRPYPVRAKREVKLVRLLGAARYARREAGARSAGPWHPFDDYLALCAKQLDAKALADYRTARELLTRLRDTVVASGAEFVVALFSYRTTIEPAAREAFESGENAAAYDLDRPERELLAILGDAGIDTINLNDALRTYHGGSRDRPPLYFEVDGHFNERGHAVVADALAAALRARVRR